MSNAKHWENFVEIARGIFEVTLLAICLEFGVILGVELLPWIAESWSQNTEKKRDFEYQKYWCLCTSL
jgi:hypothetical protein